MDENLTPKDVDKSRYQIGNRNKSDERRVLTAYIEEDKSLNVAQKTYLNIRFFDALFALDRLAILNKKFYYIAGGAVLVFNAIIPFFSIFNLKIPIISISTAAVIMYGLLKVHKNDQMWLHHRLKFELIRGEMYRYLNLSENYSQYRSLNEGYKEFVRRAEEMFDKEIVDYFTTLGVGGDKGLPNQNNLVFKSGQIGYQNE